MNLTSYIIVLILLFFFFPSSKVFIYMVSEDNENMFYTYMVYNSIMY